jgi:hypothetical protein
MSSVALGFHGEDRSFSMEDGTRGGCDVCQWMAPGTVAMTFTAQHQM